MTRKQKLHLAAAATAALNVGALAQFAQATDIYTETWGGPLGAPYTTTTTTVGTSTVVGGVLTISSGSPGATGHTRTFQDVTTSGLYNAAYNTQIDNNGNANILTWDLNLQYQRSAPSGFGSGNYGAAYVLAASNSDFMGAGEGYAVTVGSTGTDPVCLVHYTAGMSAIGLGAKSSPFNMITGGYDANQRYNSVRITYEPGNDTWKMYLRDDGASAFTDAITTPVPAGNLVGSTVLAASATAMNFTGFLQNYATAANQLARFDNIKLTLDTAPVPTPRNLLWDSDATGAATDGSGTWATANTWIDQADGVTHTTWVSANPDNATFGAGSGAGAASIDAGAGQVVGLLTFEDNSPTYTINNGTLTVTGYDDDANPVTALEGLIAQQSATINSGLTWPNDAHIHVNGSGTVLTVNGALSGGGFINKFGGGTLLLNTPAPSRGGQMDIETGTVKVTSASGGITGLGTGQTNVKQGGTLWFDASAGAISIQSGSGQLFMGDGGTLRVTGDVTWQKNFPMFSNGPDAGNARSSTISVDSGGILLFRAQLRNSGTTAENFHTINVTGPGTVKLTNSGSDSGGDSTIYSGSWVVSDGKLVLGQNTETGGSSGDTLNALGFKNGRSGLGNRVTVSGSGVLVGTENAANPSSHPIDAYKADVVLAGGTLASGNGKDSRWGGPFTTAASTTSTIALYDPLSPSTPRNVSLTNGTEQTGVNPGDLIQQGNTTWNGNLVVDKGSASGSPAFNISREGGVVSVTPGATITVNSGARMNLGINQGNINGLDAGTLDALSDGTNHVNVTNNGEFHVYTGTKNVGSINGTGNTTVTSSTTMNATVVRQGTLTVTGPQVNIRPQADPYSVAANAGTSKVTSLALGSNKLDLSNTKLITQDASMVSTPVYDGLTDTYIYDGVHGLVQKGRGDGSWNGAQGITTTQTDATTGILTSLAVGTGAELRGLGPTDTELYGGQTINGNSTVVLYTYGGDADMDGDLDGDDYFYLDSNVLQSETVFGWHQGDFNYDGRLNGDDYFVLDSNILQAQASGNIFYVRDPEFAAGSGGLTAVPEPASIGLLGMAAAGLLGRRRRSR